MVNYIRVLLVVDLSLCLVHRAWLILWRTEDGFSHKSGEIFCCLNSCPPKFFPQFNIRHAFPPPPLNFECKFDLFYDNRLTNISTGFSKVVR